MYQVSDAYKAAIANGNEQRVFIDYFNSDTFITSDDVSIEEGVALHEGINSETDLTMGTCIASTISFTLLNEEKQLSTFSFGKFRAHIGVNIAEEASELPEGCLCRVGNFYGYSEKPYMRYGSTATTKQPPFPVYCMVRDGDTIYMANSIGTVAKGIISNNDITTIYAKTVNSFMKRKLKLMSGKGYYRTGKYIYEWYDGFKKQFEYAPLGLFDSERPNVTQSSTISIEGTDMITSLDVDVPRSSITYPITVSNLYKKICEHCGLEYETLTFTNSTVSVAKEPSAFVGATCRDVISWIAELACSYARMSRDGKLQLIWFSSTDSSYDEETYTEYSQYYYTTPAITSLKVRDQNKYTEKTYTSATRSGGSEYVITDNPFLDPNDTTASGAILDRLSSVSSYRPGSVDIFTDTNTQPGDIITVSKDGTTYDVPVFSLDTVWKGSTEAVVDTSGNKHRSKPSKMERRSYSGGYGTNKRIGDAEEEIVELEGSYAFKNNAQVGAVLGKFGYNQTTGEVTLRDGAISYLRQNPDGSYSSIDVVGTIDTLEDGVETITGSQLWQNKDSIIGAVGTINSINGRVSTIEGSTLWANADSIITAVGTINAIDGRVSTIEGSAIYTNRDHINALSGKFSIDNNGNVVLAKGSELYIDNTQISAKVKESANKWAAITVTASAINSVVSSLDGEVVVTQGSDAWSVVATNASHGNTAYGVTSSLSVTASEINASVADVNTMSGAYLHLSSSGALLQGKGNASVSIKASNVIAGTIDGTTTYLNSMISTAAGEVRIKSTAINVGTGGTFTTLDSLITTAPGSVKIKSSQVAIGTSGTYSTLDSMITTAPGSVKIKASEVAYKKSDGTYTDVKSEINVNAGNIELKVSKNGVISSINQTAEEITIQASKINLSGYVTTSSLNSVEAKIDNLKSGATEASTLKTKLLNVSQGITYQNHACSFRTVTIDGTTYHLLSY